jgi:hypothetical protein
MWVQGMLGKHRITSLMDSKSTNNFLITRWVEKMGLKLDHTGRLSVIVASEKLDCCGLCKVRLLWLEAEPFLIDFFLLLLGGNDVILGTQWFQTLGPICWQVMYEILVEGE